jgi:hypothetical protein
MGIEDDAVLGLVHVVSKNLVALGLMCFESLAMRNLPMQISLLAKGTGLVKTGFKGSRLR